MEPYHATDSVKNFPFSKFNYFTFNIPPNFTLVFSLLYCTHYSVFFFNIPQFSHLLIGKLVSISFYFEDGLNNVLYVLHTPKSDILFPFCFLYNICLYL